MSACDLAAMQRDLLALIKGHPRAQRDDAWLTAVEGSLGLQVVREVANWWRLYQLEQACPLTTRYLKLRNVFAVSVQDFTRECTMPAYVEALSDDYLSYVWITRDGFCRTIAAFEQSLLRVKRGSAHEYSVDWPYEPMAALGALLSGADPEAVSRAEYRTLIARRYPHQFTVQALPSTARSLR